MLDLVRIDQSPSHPLDEQGGGAIAFELAWDHPLLEQDNGLASFSLIRHYENSWQRGPPSLIGPPSSAAELVG